MITIQEIYLEWALKHLQRYYDSDFYPKLFEIKAIAHNWNTVKDYILSIDLETYIPKSPVIELAPKANDNYRIVHQLDPIDSLLYTALIYELSTVIEDYRIPASEKIAFSYRIKPDIDGSFFDKEDTGWNNYITKAEELSGKFKDGYVVLADIADFYNQIYTHRIQNLICEAGKGSFDDKASIVEKFLLGLNKKTSRGIPVGPAPSIILAELIMGDIDKKIVNYTRNFVRYVDDIRIFFDNKEDAIFTLHELTRYLYSSHRLVFSGEKTKIIPTELFLKEYLTNEDKEENIALLQKAEELTLKKVEELFASIDHYNYDCQFDQEEYDKLYKDVLKKEQFKILSSAYYDLFDKVLKSEKFDIAILRHLLRKATRYRIRNLIPLILVNFEKLLPIIREVIIYLQRVLNKKCIVDNVKEFKAIFSSHYLKIPFVNLWLSYLLQNESFNEISLPSDYKLIKSIKDQAMIALRKGDITWVKDYRDGIDVLGPWDKRAVIYSSLLLSLDEMKPWVEAVASSGDIIDKSIASLVLSMKKSR